MVVFPFCGLVALCCSILSRKMNDIITAIVWLLSNTHTNARTHICEFRSKMNFIISQMGWTADFINLFLILSIFFDCNCKWIFRGNNFWKIKIIIINWRSLELELYDWSSFGQPIFFEKWWYSLKIYVLARGNSNSTQSI